MRVYWCAYQNKRFHSDELLKRCQASNPAVRVRLSSGRATKTMNGMLETAAAGRFDWLLPVDPHIVFTPKARVYVENWLKRVPARCGVVKFLVRQNGPQGAWAPLTKKLPIKSYLLVAFKVSALKPVKFRESKSGRNWLPATEMALVDQGWTVQYTKRVVGVHDDPTLTMDYWLVQRYLSGRAFAELFLEFRNHRHFPVEVFANLQLAGLVSTSELQARLFAKAGEYAWLLGAIEALGVSEGEVPNFAFELKVEEVT